MKAICLETKSVTRICRHSLKVVFGMINDTRNLQGRVRALLRLGQENWIG